MSTKATKVFNQSEEPDDHNPSLQDLLKASMIIDKNVDEEENRRLKLEAMADHGLVEPTSNPKSTKKATDDLAAANKRLQEANDEIEALRQELAKAKQPAPVVPTPPTVPVATPDAGAPANPFASGVVPTPPAV